MVAKFNLEDVKPTPNAVRVYNISPNATEKALKDFFAFCGKINRFQMVKAEDGATQEAFILFDKESAANTARLLSNAVIVDRQVKVESYFDGTANPSAEAAVEEDTAKAHAAAASGNSDPHTKTFTHVIAEMLAAGYVLSDNVVHKGHELDVKFGVTSTLQNYINQAKAQAVALDAKYHVVDTVTSKATELDQKFHVTATAQAATGKAMEIGGQVLNTPVGKKVVDAVGVAKTKVLELHEETKRIADTKKAATTPASTSATPQPQAQKPASAATSPSK